MLAATGARPKIFLAALGTQAEFTPRTTFAENFFEAAGIEVVGGATIEAAALAAAFKASGATLACLCSSDKVYERRRRRPRRRSKPPARDTSIWRGARANRKRP